MSRNDRESELNNSGDGYKTILSIRITYVGMALLVMALVAVGVILYLFFKKENTREFSDESPKVILAGDSIFAYFQDERSVASQLSGMMGEEVLDSSFGGSCLSYYDRDGRLDDTTDCLSMAALTQAITTGDFRYQKNATLTLDTLDYSESRLQDIEKTDYSKAEVLIIEHLINDYHNGVPAASGSNPYDEYTYEGALRSVVKSLKKQYPDLRIIIAAPILTWYPTMVTVTDENGVTTQEQDFEHMVTSHERDFGGGTVDVYMAAQKKVADEFGLEYIDLSESFDNTAFEDRYTYSDEGLHPSELGSRMIAEYINGYLSENR